MGISERHSVTARIASVVLVGSFALTSCKSEKKTDATMIVTDSSAATALAPAAAPAPTLTDPQVAMIAVVANSADSAAGVQAKEKAMNPDVKGFAQTMITDHTAVNKQATELVTKLKVTPEATDASRKLQADAENARNAFAGKAGKDYDKSYIENEVSYHQAVLDALDKQLIPSAQNAELKNLLTQVRPAVAAHLDRAKLIQAKLAS